MAISGHISMEEFDAMLQRWRENNTGQVRFPEAPDIPSNKKQMCIHMAMLFDVPL